MEISSAITVKLKFLSSMLTKLYMPFILRTMAVSVPTLNSISIAAIAPICLSLKIDIGASLAMRLMVTAFPLPYFFKIPGTKPSHKSVFNTMGMLLGMIV